MLWCHSSMVGLHPCVVPFIHGWAAPMCGAIHPWLGCTHVWCHWGEIEPFSATLAQDGLAKCDQPGKKLCLGWEWNPRRGHTVRYIHSPTELSWPGPRGGQTVRYIHFPATTPLKFIGAIFMSILYCYHSPYMHMYVCTCVYMHMYVCTCVYMHMYICTYVYMHMYICICVYACIYAIGIMYSIQWQVK